MQITVPARFTTRLDVVRVKREFKNWVYGKSSMELREELRRTIKGLCLAQIVNFMSLLDLGTIKTHLVKTQSIPTFLVPYLLRLAQRGDITNLQSILVTVQDLLTTALRYRHRGQLWRTTGCPLCTASAGGVSYHIDEISGDIFVDPWRETSVYDVRFACLFCDDVRAVSTELHSAFLLVLSGKTIFAEGILSLLKQVGCK